MEFQSWEGAAESSCKREENSQRFSVSKGRRRGVGTRVERDYNTERHHPQLESALEFFWRELSWPLRAGGRAGGVNRYPTTHAPVWMGSD